jgi:3-phosphoshikimate 1-carboxyvinyltransferase
MKQTIRRVQQFKGSPKIPGDKSISHRGLILGALAKGRSEVVDILEGGDVQSTARCLRQLGVTITKKDNRTFIDGIGGTGFTQPTEILDCGNSGTTMRVMMGVLAGRNINATLTGDHSLVKRPMKRVSEPLKLMGAKFKLTNENFAPLEVTGTRIHGIEYDLKIASAQIKTAIIMAGISAEGTTKIVGEIGSRDHTERLLPHFGVKIEVTDKHIAIVGGQQMTANQVIVPGDPSTAAFWVGTASIIPNSKIEMHNISLNPTRTGFLEVLKRMGAKIRTEITSHHPEPVGSIYVETGTLNGTEVTKEEIPSMIDEIPLLAVIATQAKGTTIVHGAEELRVKESDRLEAVASNLRAMGCEIDVYPDGFKIEGTQKLKGATLPSFHDHRIAMAFSVAGLVADGDTAIEDADCVSISYPGFYDTLKELTQT